MKLLKFALLIIISITSLSSTAHAVTTVKQKPMTVHVIDVGKATPPPLIIGVFI